MRFQLKNIQPNPFRHVDRYPITKEKVEALRESIRTTGFWDNIVAREVNGKAEITYGHHRLVALREEYGPDHEVVPGRGHETLRPSLPGGQTRFPLILINTWVTRFFACDSVTETRPY